jgi:hypothetical protein
MEDKCVPEFPPYLDPLKMYSDGGNGGLKYFAGLIGRHHNEINPVKNPIIFADEIIRYLSRFQENYRDIDKLFKECLSSKDSERFVDRYINNKRTSDNYDFSEGLEIIAKSIDIHKLFQERILNIPINK